MRRVPKPSVILESASTGGFFVLVLLFCPGLQAQIYIGGEGGWTGLSGQTDTISGITSPTARFNGGFNTGVRGGYEWEPWRFEEEYSYRQNGARDVVGSNFTVNAAGGDRHSNSIMTNVLYDFTPGYPMTPHVGFGVGAADIFDGLKLPGIGQVLNGNSWQFAYQGIAGIRYHLSDTFTLDLDYRFFATIGPSFSIARTNLQYSTYYRTNNFVASVTYRFVPPPTAPAPVSVPAVPIARTCRARAPESRLRASSCGPSPID